MSENRLTDGQLRFLLQVAQENWTEADMARRAVEELATLRAALAASPGPEPAWMEALAALDAAAEGNAPVNRAALRKHLATVRRAIGSSPGSASPGERVPCARFGSTTTDEHQKCLGTCGMERTVDGIDS